MKLAASTSASGHAFLRSVFNTTPCSPVVLGSDLPCPGLSGANTRSEPEHLEDASRGRSCGTVYGGRPKRACGSARSEPRLSPHACAQQAHEQAEEARHHGEIIRACRVARRVARGGLVRVAHRPGCGVVPSWAPRTIDALGGEADQVQGAEDPVAE